MKALVVEKDTEISEILLFALESRFAATVVTATDAETAIAHMKFDAKAFDLIICNIKGVWPNAIKDLEPYRGKIPIVELLPVKSSKDTKAVEGHAEKIHPGNIFEDAPQVIEDLFERSLIDPNKRKYNFCRLDTSLLLKHSPLKANMYIRLSDEKFLKIFHSGEEFGKEDFEKYTEKKGVKYLFIRNDEIHEFILKFKNTLKEFVDKEPIPTEEGEEMLVSSITTVNEMVRKVGITQDVQELVKTNVGLSMKLMGKRPDLVKILERLKVDPDKYIPSHSMLLAHVSCGIASALKWTSQGTYQKLTMAALFHDIALTNHDLAKIRNLKELTDKRDTYTKKQSDAFKAHPEKAAALLKGMGEVLPDVDTIVIQHHEDQEGTGFPRRIDHLQIAPLAALFIVAEELVRTAYEEEAEFDPVGFFNKKINVYRFGHFKQIIRAVRKLKLDGLEKAS